MENITLIKFIPANTLCEFAESITRWKCAKRKCKTFQLLHHRVIELTELNNEPLSIAAMRVGSPDRSPVTIQGGDAAPKSSILRITPRALRLATRRTTRVRTLLLPLFAWP